MSSASNGKRTHTISSSGGGGSGSGSGSGSGGVSVAAYAIAAVVFAICGGLAFWRWSYYAVGAVCVMISLVVAFGAYALFGPTPISAGEELTLIQWLMRKFIPRSLIRRRSASGASGASASASARPPAPKQRVDLIYARDRRSGELIREKIPLWLSVSLRYIYQSLIGAYTARLNAFILRVWTIYIGYRFTSPASRSTIKPFIAFHSIDMTQFSPSDPDQYHNFNAFFYRKLSPNARPIAHPTDSTVAVSPADCRLLVFESISEATRIWIKGKHFSLHSLLQHPPLIDLFRAESPPKTNASGSSGSAGSGSGSGSSGSGSGSGSGGGSTPTSSGTATDVSCSLAICRLAPQDYHRFHYPVSASDVQASTHFDGAYDSVNPMAVRSDARADSVLATNKRVVTPMHGTPFGCT